MDDSFMEQLRLVRLVQDLIRSSAGVLNHEQCYRLAALLNAICDLENECPMRREMLN